MIKLVLPSYEYEESYNKFIEEVIINNEKDDLGNAYRENETFNEMLTRIHNRKYGIGISTNDVPSTIYFISQNNEVVGTIDLRSYLNKSYYYKFGHIAYIVKPSVRHQGIATYALKQAIKIYKSLNVEKILLVCYKENIASKKVIQKNNGYLEREYINEENKTIQRYWIDI